MNTTYGTSYNGYQTLAGLLLDEKMSRHQLENKIDNMEQTLTMRLSSLEQSYSEVTNELKKDRNNRQQLIDETTRLSLKLMNATEDRNAIQQSFKTLLSDYNVLNDSFRNLTESHRKLNEDTKNWTSSQGSLEQKVQNLTEEQTLLSNKYHVLLEQYLKVTSNNQYTFVEKQTFTTKLDKLEHRLLEMSTNISSNRQSIQNSILQLGFSLETVDNTSTSDRLKFKKSRFSSPGIFNMSSGEFVCKVDGLYFFTATIVRGPGIVESYCSIYVNGSWKVATVGYGSTTDGYASGTTSLVYHLTVGDRVYLGYCHGIDHM